jgi:hypothetical protein
MDNSFAAAGFGFHPSPTNDLAQPRFSAAAGLNDM